jgi:DNA-binding protein HU-beta
MCQKASSRLYVHNNNIDKKVRRSGKLFLVRDIARHCYDCRAFHPTPQGDTMNKSELIDAVAAKTDLSKAAAGRAVEAVLDVITETVAKSDTVSVIGFGTFEARKRAARNGKNPKTGEAIKIAATTVPAFKPGKAFKDKVAAKKAKKK